MGYNKAVTHFAILISLLVISVPLGYHISCKWVILLSKFLLLLMRTFDCPVKYMSKRNDCSSYCDEVIYPQLFIGKIRYYELKKRGIGNAWKELIWLI